MKDGYLSRNRAHLAALQRKRRARMVRVDYMPSEAALAVIEAKRATLPEWGGLSTNSAIIDAIVTEWAEMTGIKYGKVANPKSPGQLPELPGKYAQVRMSPALLPCWNRSKPDKTARPASLRVPCRAKRHRDGQPCQALSEPGKRRCRFHGGRSTGPKTGAGKARALTNLRQYRKP